MLFTTDKQTLDDLNIFGKHGSDSVYSIFNRTNTRSAAQILEEMFNYPFSDEPAINRRSGIIQYFASAGTRFPFENALFDAIDPYLDNNDERTKLSPDNQTVGDKLIGLIGVPSEIATIYKGITALVGLLRQLQAFLQSLDNQAAHLYLEDSEGMVALLKEPDFEPVLNNSNTRLSHNTMAAYDVLFRFRHRDSIRKLLRYIAFLDVYISVAGVANELRFVFPKALPAGHHSARLEGVYHPQVKNAVPNTLNITPKDNVVFLTGANMAGKSTFMKSVSIALFLAHMGFPVPAARMEFSVLDGIYTTINLPDNLGMGASHFYAEVLRAKKVAGELKAGKNLLIVFDELFRGTNVKDAYEATIAFTEAFARRRNSLFVISTHIIEAGEVLKERCDNINFVYLPTRMDGMRPVYTYTLQQGITADRHGMVIINNERILEMLAAGLGKLKKI